MQSPVKMLRHRPLLVGLFGFSLLAVCGGCAVHGTVDVCSDVRNDETNVLRKHDVPSR